jgi:dienelactone hydrolase
MTTSKLLDPERKSSAWLVFSICMVVLVASSWLASRVQQDFGRVSVENVSYPNYNGIPIRAKLMRPETASAENPVPGILYIHGYQNNRETSDAYCIEFARRGIAVLSIDAIGRGNSGVPGLLSDPEFDDTYGGLSSLKFLKTLPFVDLDAVGLAGHSLGAEMVYRLALLDRSIRGLVISGFAYTEEATAASPKNMLMIFGKYDEFRRRMTGTEDFESEWMATGLTRKVFDTGRPEFGRTYGDFEAGTARRVFTAPISHLHTSHSKSAVAEAVKWMRQALKPADRYWIPAAEQIWPMKEWATLLAMLAGLAALMPLGLMLLRTRFFSPLKAPLAVATAYTPKSYFRAAAMNTVLMWLYFPIIFVLFGIHVYLVPIDRAFPLMMVNGIVWWFLWIHLIGFLFFRGWFRKQHRETGLTLWDLGISYTPEKFTLGGTKLAKTLLLGVLLSGFACLCEYTLERLLIVDWRFVFPFASDLTAYRFGLWLVYFPWLLVGFVLMGIFLHGRMRRPMKQTWLRTYLSWTAANLMLVIGPLMILLLVQYVPLFSGGDVPLVGPGGMLVAFTHNLIHVILVLLMIVPLSTWFFQLTGKIYLGAVVSAALVTWMFTASQVVAPIPI